MDELNGRLQPLDNKKPYEEPRFYVYGDITTITQTQNVTGAFDGTNKGTVHKTV